MLIRLIMMGVLLAAPSADALLLDLQRAVARDDRAAVAALIQYPMTIAASGVRISIKDTAALIQSYEAVFTPDIKAAIRDGSAIRDGLIRVAAVGGAFKITNIAAAASGGTARGRTTRSAPAAPRRLTFAAAQQLAQATGALSPGNGETFVAYVEKGKLLEARIDRVQGRDVVLKVVDAKTGQPLDEKAAAGARTWAGRVPESGDYRIDVLRSAETSGPSLTYLLVVRKR